MSFDIPASVERDVESYAEAKHISPDEAVVRLIQRGLNATKSERRSQGALTEAEWEKLRRNTNFMFLRSMPDSTAAAIQEASRQTRAERFRPRA